MPAYQLNQCGKVIRILLVLDDQIFASFVACLLDDLRFDVAGIVSTDSEAAAIAHAQRPDLALVDIRRGRPMAGIEVARMLKQDFGVPSVFLTGSIDGKFKTEVQDAHLGALLDAPLRPSQALKAVEEALKLLSG
jgi:two-component system, response regulator PdtaR